MASTRGTEGVRDLVAVLRDLGLVATDADFGGDVGVDAVLSVDGRRLPVEVKLDVRESEASDLIGHMPDHSLVVADRFSPVARDLLQEHHIGWLDRRGHIRLVLPPGIFIDRDIDSLIVEAAGRVTNLFTTPGFDVAMALLLDPTERIGVREMSRRTGVSVGRVSELLSELRTRGLVSRDGTPATPDLFDAVADAWKPDWVDLGGTPPPDPTLRLGGLHAAIWHRVPLVITEGWPPENYARDEFALRRLVRTYPPDAEQKIVPITKAAVCPSPYGFDRSLDSDLAWPVVNHVVAALDLALDQGRGREALAEWEPEGVIRVW
jgi:hypothetical protein